MGRPIRLDRLTTPTRLGFEKTNQLPHEVGIIRALAGLPSQSFRADRSRSRRARVGHAASPTPRSMGSERRSVDYSKITIGRSVTPDLGRGRNRPTE